MDPKILIEKPNPHLPGARNKTFTIFQALDNDCTHVMFVDDGIVIPPNTVEKLYSHNKDVITGLYLMKTYPHFPAVYNGVFDDGKQKFLYLDKDIRGLIPIINCGMGCVLIKTEVFKTVKYPWIKFGGLVKEGGYAHTEFFNRVKEAGFEMFCDTDVRVGNIHTSTLYPGNRGDAWYTEYRNDNGSVLAQQMIPKEDKW